MAAFKRFFAVHYAFAKLFVFAQEPGLKPDPDPDPGKNTGSGSGSATLFVTNRSVANSAWLRILAYFVLAH